MADIDTTSATETTTAATPLMPKTAALVGNWAVRSAGSGIAAAALLPWRTDPQSWPQIWHELWQMQQAAWQRQRQLQDNWLHAWLGWTNECIQARGANTMAKQVEREFNLIGQLHQLISDQATDAVGLLENLEINYAYWVNQKLR